MEYVISKVYYMELLTALRKDNKTANHRSVVEYLNKTVGGIKKVKYI